LCFGYAFGYAPIKIFGIIIVFGALIDWNKFILLFCKQSLRRTVITMARPIKDTPILNGKDAILFLDEMRKNESKKPDLKERERIKNNASKFRFATFV
jgi:hypothetical protein